MSNKRSDNNKIIEDISPDLDQFLEFLAQDIAKHPEKSVLTFPQSLFDRATALTAGMTIDIDEDINGDVDI